MDNGKNQTITKKIAVFGIMQGVGFRPLVYQMAQKLKQFILRSPGYAPYPVFLSQGDKEAEIFAAGSDLKAAFCLYKNGKAVVSQYFGDLEEYFVFEEYKHAVSDLSQLLSINPSYAVCDLHPNYHSRKFTTNLGIPVHYVQHHHAHIASVMAEYNLRGPVIGVAFDGTGYGTDGNIWGGEFLVCEGAKFQRAAHLNYISILGGDSSMKDAKKTATCFLLSYNLVEYIRDKRCEIIRAAIEQHINTVLTSSMGRLFEAVASLLDIKQENSYEGECAANLEREAIFADRNHITPEKLNFSIIERDDRIGIDPKPVLQSICELRDNTSVGSLALGFHEAVVSMIIEVCERIRVKHRLNTVALSGGVFQNTILTEKTVKQLRKKGFQVYINSAVPPNDGSISLGQTYVALMKLKKQ